MNVNEWQIIIVKFNDFFSYSFILLYRILIQIELGRRRRRKKFNFFSIVLIFCLFCLGLIFFIFYFFGCVCHSWKWQTTEHANFFFLWWPETCVCVCVTKLENFFLWQPISHFHIHITQTDTKPMNNNNNNSVARMKI